MKDQIGQQLDGIRELLTEARSVPMSASVMVNRDEVLDLLARLEQTIDQALDEATEVIAGRHAQVEAGEEQAAQILREAERHRDDLVSDTSVFTLASERAEEIIAAARAEAEELRAETDDYVETYLADFEQTLDAILSTVRRGRSRLTHGHAHGLSDDSDVADIELPDHLDA